MGRDKVAEVWDNYWKSRTSIPKKEGSSYLIPLYLKEIFNRSFDGGEEEFTEFAKIVKDFSGLKILEAGSGTGRFSLKLAQSGAEVLLLDISWHALEISRKIFRESNQKATFIQGSIFSMPFANESFDIVFSSGLLEHFDKNDQISAISEMARVCKSSGLIVIFSPYYYAVLYRLGKWWAERTGKWEFGDEFPVKSLKEIGEMAGLSFQSEYPICYGYQLNFLKYFNPWIARVAKLGFILIWGSRNPVWKRIFMGSCLVSIFKTC